MTSSAGPQGQTPAEQKELISGYYDSYSQWTDEALTKRDLDLSKQQATFSVQGTLPSDPLYQSAINRINTTYEDTISEIEAGQTFASLTQYFDTQKDVLTRFYDGEQVSINEYRTLSSEDRVLMSDFEKARIAYETPADLPISEMRNIASIRAKQKSDFETLQSQFDERKAGISDLTLQSYYEGSGFEYTATPTPAEVIQDEITTRETASDASSVEAKVSASGAGYDRRVLPGAVTEEDAPWW